MALYQDGPPSNIEDLSAQDSQLQDVASTEEINVTGKLALAYEQIGMEIEALLRRLVPAGQWAVALSSPGIASVVVTTPLRLWHTYRTLKLVYGDAYYNQLNDRYSQKRNAFEKQARWAYEALIEAGIGMVRDPVAMAGTPLVLPAAGPLLAGTYYVTASWLNAAGEEGSPAIPASLTVSNQTLRVQPPSAPPNATGWNVYVGTAPDQMFRQNVGSAIAPSSNWQQAGAVLTTGTQPAQGQSPTYFQPVPRMIQRG